MNNIAVLLTIFNRKEKTKKCLKSLFAQEIIDCFSFDVWITDDGSTDGSSEDILALFPKDKIHILKGDGSLFWNGGMINSWNAAIKHGGYDGYLWLNNDVELLPGLWRSIMEAEDWSLTQFGKKGIYVGSVMDNKGVFSYGGFNYLSKITLKDQFVVPNGSFQVCECAHGNVTYVSSDVVDKQGVFYDGYIHGGADHDYTYLAHKNGFPLVVMKDYAGICENDHSGSQKSFEGKSLKERIELLRSPLGLNIHNILLFQKRCFPWRLPFSFIMVYAKALFPGIVYPFYRLIRH